MKGIPQINDVNLGSGIRAFYDGTNIILKVNKRSTILIMDPAVCKELYKYIARVRAQGDWK